MVMRFRLTFPNRNGVVALLGFSRYLESTRKREGIKFPAIRVREAAHDFFPRKYCGQPVAFTRVYKFCIGNVFRKRGKSWAIHRGNVMTLQRFSVWWNFVIFISTIGSIYGMVQIPSQNSCFENGEGTGKVFTTAVWLIFITLREKMRLNYSF